MTTREIVLQAAQTLSGSFTLTQLLLAAWGLQKGVLGLPGAENDHPCSRRLAAMLYGKDGMLSQGLIVPLGGGLFRLPTGTEEGRCAESAHRPKKAAEVAVQPVCQETPEAILRAQESLAYQLFTSGKSDSITYGYALQFWGGTALRKKVKEFGALLRPPLATVEMRELSACHDYLWGRFAKHLKSEV